MPAGIRGFGPWKAPPGGKAPCPTGQLGFPTGLEKPVSGFSHLPQPLLLLAYVYSLNGKERRQTEESLSAGAMEIDPMV